MSLLREHMPAAFRGITGWDRMHLRVGIAFSTLDGNYHQFVISDLDLRRLGLAVSEAFPDLQFGPQSPRDGFHSDSDAGSRGAAETAVGAETAHEPDRSAANTSSGVAP